MDHKNIFAIETIKYIWTHPNCKNTKIQSILKFVSWQLYKRLTQKYIDIQLVNNIKIRCHTDSRSAAAALYCGLYDYHDMNFLLRYLRAEDSFLDIGANIGIYTLLAASIIKNGTIYSFEALPKNYTRLEENIRINQLDQVKTYSLAISNLIGNIALNLAEGDSMPFISTQSHEKTLTVKTDTLNNILNNESLSKLTLAKIDIEGAELLALKGATSLLKKQLPHVWIMEINNAVSNFDYNKEDLVNFLQDYGYGLFQYNADNNQIIPITLEQQQGNNVLVIANSCVEFVHDRLN
ncbi:FkbM family methyltransferase [Anabaena sphaerica FACHB-251]|uniref:FkbM family methyltransferase n=1 Tax=Anabaena sphaerica FACHB-251 TaxID=2692883 RepID=A0A926WFV7_9NOST|nr:FkbM family methyltransferase [Anabaena sphaerica]MBD2292363.1 FkbM family methyltransferase [Anabaena sphaerica FACHB-251]